MTDLVNCCCQSKYRKKNKTVNVDVVIIGAGVCGASVARELARYDLKVTVLEKSSDVCAGASRGNSAMVHGGFDAEAGSNKAKFNVLGNQMFDELCAELDVPFQRSGTMVLATSAEEMKDVLRLHSNGLQNGVDTQVLRRDELRKRWPTIAEDAVGALFCPSGGIVCPYTLVIAMCENAARNGVQFFRNCAVRSIEHKDCTWRVTAADGRIFDAKAVVNCAGTHADEMNNMVSAEKIRIFPRFGAHLILDREYLPWVDTTIMQTPVSLASGGHTKGMGIMPSADGTVIIGCDAVDRTDPDDTAITAQSMDAIVDYFRKFWKYLPISRQFPEFPAEGIINAYGGLRPHCDRNDFVLGEPDDAPNFFNAAGIESPGLTAGPAIGVFLSQQIIKKLGAKPRQNYQSGRVFCKPFRSMTEQERAEAICRNADYAKMVCRCEQVTEAEIRDAIRRPVGARTINAVKMRTRAGMGRCQGGFCQSRVLEILSEELGISQTAVTLAGGESTVLAGECCSCRFGGNEHENG